MSWANHGLVFASRDWVSRDFEGHFAQSPQALVMPDRVRVFFSTRTRDHASAPWTSLVMRVDFPTSMREPLGEPVAVAMAPAKPGAFDEHGIFPFSVVRSGDEVWAYTTGWSRRQAVDVETGIGLMRSTDDGASFERIGAGPVLSASLHEPYLVCDGFVRQPETGYRMWYCFGTGWHEDPSTGIPERTYKIGVAESPDGVTWTPAGGQETIPSTRYGVLEAQALPSVLQRENGDWAMAFCFRHTFGFRNGNGSYELGYARSRDGTTWERDDAAIAFPTAGFDDAMRCYPHLFRAEGKTFLLFNGNRFGADGFGVAEWNPRDP